MKNKHIYPKEGTDRDKDTIKKLRSQVRNLKKQNKELQSENETLLEAWSKTEAFLAEITDGVPLEELLKHRNLPKKATRKTVTTNDDNIDEIRTKWSQWRKDNL
jgi:predicted RNase H-like nuclease (RuvC/YqgF family)